MVNATRTVVLPQRHAYCHPVMGNLSSEQLDLGICTVKNKINIALLKIK